MDRTAAENWRVRFVATGMDMQPFESILKQGAIRETAATVILVDESMEKDLEGFISDGSLREKPGSCSVKEIQEGKAWPDDLIYIEFESVPNGTVYILSCETFHGMGGVFKRIH